MMGPDGKVSKLLRAARAVLEESRYLIQCRDLPLTELATACDELDDEARASEWRWYDGPVL